MQMKNIALTTSTYFPEGVEDVYDSIMQSKAYPKDTVDFKRFKHLIQDVLGKTNRYFLDDPNKTPIDMAMLAIQECLKKANKTSKDIDAITFVSVMPEYYSPPTSIVLHHLLECKDDVICKDMNINCVGMTVEMIETYKLMQADPALNNCLIINADYLNPILRENQYSSHIISDSATAILLHTEPNVCSGLLDSYITTRSNQIGAIAGPINGYSHMHRTHQLAELKMDMGVVNCELDFVTQKLQELVTRNGLNIRDVKGFFFSQYVKRNCEKLQKALEVDSENVFYIGDKYGYTGTSSPFVALNEAVDLGKVTSGDLCVVWTLGAGTEHAFALLRL